MKLPKPDREIYNLGFPFPSISIDDVFDNEDLRELLRHWPKDHGKTSNNIHECLKHSTVTEKGMGKHIADFIKINFQSQEFICWLEKMTGITGLVFDVHHFGLHETFPGGGLMPHLDYNQSHISGLQLRINVILFLNENWDPSYEGALNLYDKNPGKGKTNMRSIFPLMNRLVIFNNDKNTWHGHPEPLKCPEGMSRKSIALNYFTIPQNDLVAQRTIFSNEKNSLLKQLIPPILLKAYSKIK